MRSPIFTYANQGTKKPGVVPDEHAIVYSSGNTPSLLSGESQLSKEPICIIMKDGVPLLSSASRVFFGIHHSVQYNIKVKELGHVHPDHLPNLLGYWHMENEGETQQPAEVTEEGAFDSSEPESPRFNRETQHTADQTQSVLPETPDANMEIKPNTDQTKFGGSEGPVLNLKTQMNIDHAPEVSSAEDHEPGEQEGSGEEDGSSEGDKSNEEDESREKYESGEKDQLNEEGLIPSLVQDDTEVQNAGRVITSAFPALKSNLSEFDSGYGSMSRPATWAEFSDSGIQGTDLQSHAIDTRNRIEVHKDDDILSLISENDDIGSQLSIETTKAGLTGAALIGVFLAENPQFRSLCEKVLNRVDKPRFTDNVRRLLRSFHKNLSSEAKSVGEKAVAGLLGQRRARLHISHQLIDRIAGLGIATEDKISLEKWLADISDAPADLLEQHLGGSDDDSAEEHDEFPFTSELKQFLQESESFKSLLRDFTLWLLPIDLRQVFLSIPRSRIWVSLEQDTSLMNLVKAWMEDNTKVRWNWWPLEARKRFLKDDECRLFWRCVC